MPLSLGYWVGLFLAFLIQMPLFLASLLVPGVEWKELPFLQTLVLETGSCGSEATPLSPQATPPHPWFLPAPMYCSHQAQWGAGRHNTGDLKLCRGGSTQARGLTFGLWDGAGDGGAGGSDCAHGWAHTVRWVGSGHRRRVGNPGRRVDGSDGLTYSKQDSQMWSENRPLVAAASGGVPCTAPTSHPQHQPGLTRIGAWRVWPSPDPLGSNWERKKRGRVNKKGTEGESPLMAQWQQSWGCFSFLWSSKKVTPALVKVTCPQRDLGGGLGRVGWQLSWLWAARRVRWQHSEACSILGP